MLRLTPSMILFVSSAISASESSDSAPGSDAGASFALAIRLAIDLGASVGLVLLEARVDGMVIVVKGDILMDRDLCKLFSV